MRRLLVQPAVVCATILALPCPRVGAQMSGETVTPLPPPRGRFAVGTVVEYLEDVHRRDADFPRARPVTLQLWYPAERSGDSTARYLVEPALPAALLQSRYYGVDSASLARWAVLSTHSLAGARPVPGRHPLLLFSVGLGVIRANYTSIAEALASHGYVVALVESPMQGLLVLRDGRVVADSAGRYGEAAPHRAGVAGWARDLSFVLDRLTAREMSPAAARVAAVIDRTSIGALGHSTGGLVAAAGCVNDPRIRACVNMDGGVVDPAGEPLAYFVTRGVTRPTLFLRSQPLYDDSTLARRGMTRAEWVSRGEAGRRAVEAVRDRSRGPLRLAQIAGTGHFSFTDAPFVMPSAVTRFGGRIIAPERGLEVITAALRAFFEHEFEHRGGCLSRVAAGMPELTISE